MSCMISAWTSWRECSASCGGQGTTTRAREIVVAAHAGGQACPTTLETATGLCVTALCPVDCSVSAWSSWSPCSVSCGAGATVRTRSVIQQPMNGGQLCGLTSESSPCAALFCPVDCSATAWMSWQTCSSLCSGTKRAPTVTIQISLPFVWFERFCVSPSRVCSHASVSSTACPCIRMRFDLVLWSSWFINALKVHDGGSSLRRSPMWGAD